MADTTARDLARLEPWGESLERSQMRRALADAPQRPSELLVGRRGASVAAMVAVAGAPAGAVAGAALATPSVAQAAHFKAIHHHAIGARVAKMQRLLHIHADGRFGTGTLKVVKRFQRRHGLTADGVVGAATWHALERANATHASSGSHRRSKVPASRARAIQRALGLTVDGVYGPHTKRAVKRFQARHGLTVDGIPGPQTMAAMHRARASHHHRSARRVSHAHGSVRTLQRRLGIATDGVFGPGTEHAVKSFQRRHGLTADGIVGPATWRALGVRSSKVLKRKHRGSTHSTRGRSAIGRLIAAGYRIATLPYVYGGGHGSFHASGYDCSGSVSYVLHAAGLLRSPLDSSSFMSWGRAGRGRHITVYTNPGHAYLVVDGRRFDTSAMSETGGSRWTNRMRDNGGFVARHPAGF